MHGKQTLRKTIQQTKRSAQAKPLKPSSSYMEIGSWRFQENEDGDLIVMNLETQQNVILFRREGGEGEDA